MSDLSRLSGHSLPPLPMATPPYIYQREAWPRFTWDHPRVAQAASAAKIKQAHLLGRMAALGFDLQQDATLRTLTTEIVKSSEIEGEILNPADVRSSVARHLGMDVAGVVDRNVEGVVTMVMDATGKYAQPLTHDRLFGWHNVLFPTQMSGLRRIRVAAYRDAAMEIVSGPEGNHRVHFEAPEASKLVGEMDIFLRWFNDDGRNSEDWMIFFRARAPVVCHHPSV